MGRTEALRRSRKRRATSVAGRDGASRPGGCTCPSKPARFCERPCSEIRTQARAAAGPILSWTPILRCVEHSIQARAPNCAVAPEPAGASRTARPVGPDNGGVEAEQILRHRLATSAGPLRGE